MPGREPLLAGLHVASVMLRDKVNFQLTLGGVRRKHGYGVQSASMSGFALGSGGLSILCRGCDGIRPSDRREEVRASHSAL